MNQPLSNYVEGGDCEERWFAFVCEAELFMHSTDQADSRSAEALSLPSQLRGALKIETGNCNHSSVHAINLKYGLTQETLVDLENMLCAGNRHMNERPEESYIN